MAAHTQRASIASQALTTAGLMAGAAAAAGSADAADAVPLASCAAVLLLLLLLLLLLKSCTTRRHPQPISTRAEQLRISGSSDASNLRGQHLKQVTCSDSNLTRGPCRLSCCCCCCQHACKVLRKAARSAVNAAVTMPAA
jgi:hypothetical protein